MSHLFSRFARATANLLAHPVAFACAVTSVLVWALFGPRLGYSEWWQLVINTGTTILTFLMVFLLQHTQNRDARAVQLKLDELLRAVRGARNEMIDLENLSEEELNRYGAEFQELHLRHARVVGKRGRNLQINAEQAEVAGNSRLAKKKRPAAVKSPG